MEAVLTAPDVHRPGYGSWLLANLLGIIVGVVAALPALLLYVAMLDAYLVNSDADPLTFGTALICGSLSVIAVVAGWLTYAGVIYSRMSEWTNRNLVVTVVGIQGLALSLIPFNGYLGLLVLVVAFLLLPLILMQVAQRDPGRVAPYVIGAVLVLLAIAGPVIALSSETKPF
jgi:hypothetical protein